MIPLRPALVLSYILAVVIAMSVAALVSATSVERLYLETQQANLLAQAQRVATTLANLPETQFGPAPAPAAMTQNTAALPGVNTRIIDQNGGVLIGLPIDLSGGLAISPSEPNAAKLPADSAMTVEAPAQSGPSTPEPTFPPEPTLDPRIPTETPWPTETPAPTPPVLDADAKTVLGPENLLARPEIAEARMGKAGTAIRTGPGAGGRRVLYAAAPVFGPDNKVIQIVYISTPLPDTGLAALPADVRAQALAAGGLMAAVAGMLGLVFATLLTRPMRRWVDAAGAVARGDLSQTLSERGAVRETAQLARAFNQMTDGLRRSDRAKAQFVADVSHELRTPLTVIRGAAETLQDGAVDEPAARDSFLAAIAKEAGRLTQLVNDLLVLTRADAGALQLHRELTDVGEFIESRVRFLGPSAHKRGQTIKVDAPPGLRAEVDPIRLTQILDNLLDNALRYNPAGTPVVIKLEKLQRHGAWIECAVRDGGPGVAPEHLGKIFDRFYRVEQARDRSTGGAGLGLAITRSLVEAHGGRIEARSTPGSGTTIAFTLPAAD